MTSEDELLLFGQQWDEAIVSKEPEAIEKFMSDEWVIVGSEGITSKNSFLESIASGDLTHSRMDSEENRVRIYGDTGIVTGRGNSLGEYKGKPFALYEWSTSIYIRSEGRWSCLLTMLTPAEKKE